MDFDDELAPQLAQLEVEARTLSGRVLADNFEKRAWLLVTMEQLSPALELLEEQEQIYADLGDTEARAGCWRDQAEVLRGLERFDEALLLLDRYHHICVAMHDVAGIELAEAASEAIRVQRSPVREPVHGIQEKSQL